jgi:hypothetical protein
MESAVTPRVGCGRQTIACPLAVSPTAGASAETPDTFAGLDSLASQILALGQRYNAAVNRSAGNSLGPISTSY